LMYPSSETYYDQLPDGVARVSTKRVFKKLTLFPIIPSISYSYKF
jgi:hypothetical protein